MEKKGQLGNLQGIIATLIIIGLLIGVGFLILESFLSTDSLQDNSYTITNESSAYINDSFYFVDKATAGGFNSFAVTSVYNSSGGGGTLVVAANYTVNADTGSIVGASGRTFNLTDVNLSYTYNAGADAWIGINDTVEAMTTIPELLGLIILIAVIGIILAVIFNVIPGARVSGA